MSTDDEVEAAREEYRHGRRKRMQAGLSLALFAVPLFALLLWSPGRDLEEQFKDAPPCPSPVVSLLSLGDDRRYEPEWCGVERAQNTAWASFLVLPTAMAARRLSRVYRKHPPPSRVEYARLFSPRAPATGREPGGGEASGGPGGTEQ